jgi:hypothetical protein
MARADNASPNERAAGMKKSCRATRRRLTWSTAVRSDMFSMAAISFSIRFIA